MDLGLNNGFEFGYGLWANGLMGMDFRKINENEKEKERNKIEKNGLS